MLLTYSHDHEQFKDILPTVEDWQDFVAYCGASDAAIDDEIVEVLRNAAREYKATNQSSFGKFREQLQVLVSDGMPLVDCQKDELHAIQTKIETLLRIAPE